DLEKISITVVIYDNFSNSSTKSRLLPSNQPHSISYNNLTYIHRLDSPYIVQFKHASWTTPADIVLVTEFMEGGDLRTKLENNADKSFTRQHKIHCALDIANALGYLYTLHIKIIHRDLKSRNVLLNSQMQAKVADFGVSREIDDATMTAVLLDNHYTEAADMFSFGVILAELSSKIVPYSDMVNASRRPYTDTTNMTQVMKGELLPKFADDTPRWFYELGLRCLSLKPEDRPAALAITQNSSSLPTRPLSETATTSTVPHEGVNPIQTTKVKINMLDLELYYIPPDQLYTGNDSVIARGAFGKVLLGVHHGQPVAIKKLLNHRGDSRQIQ
ncbi:kinase, partial [Thraustotheca clavata]